MTHVWTKAGIRLLADALNKGVESGEVVLPAGLPAGDLVTIRGDVLFEYRPRPNERQHNSVNSC